MNTEHPSNYSKEFSEVKFHFPDQAPLFNVNYFQS